jgi:hypothetical protein
MLLALWVGGTWAIGLLVAPALFHLLDSRSLAGDIAGALFTRIHLVAVVAAILLAVLGVMCEGLRWLRGWRAWALFAVVAVAAVFELALAPAIADLRSTQAIHVAGSDAHARFRLLHGASAALYLFNGVLGMVLVVAGATRRGD